MEGSRHLSLKQGGVTTMYPPLAAIIVIPPALYFPFSRHCDSQGEHHAGFEAGKPDNALFKHAQLHHPGTVPAFQFQAEKFFPDATSAQIYEGVSINHSPSAEGFLMNSKAEYQQGEVARVVLVRGLAE